MRGLDRVLLRGLLRLLTLTLPLFLVLSVVNWSGDRSLFWTDEHLIVDGGPADEMTLGGRVLPGARVDVQGQLSYAVPHPPAWLWFVSMLPALVLAAAMSLVALLLLRMMTDTYAGRPFGATAAPRLRRVALVVAVAAFAVPMLDAVSVHALVGQVLPERAPGLLEEWNYAGQTVPWLAVPLLLLAVAQAFDRGAELADDVAGLV